MKVAKLAPALALAFSIPAAWAHAEGVAPAMAAEAAQAPSDAVPAAESAPTDVAQSADAAPKDAVQSADVAPVAAQAAPPAAPAEAAQTEELGPVGHDAQGRAGRIHVVQKGDTLWDISDAYLGTPWVWPSIWKDNTAEVANPHRIYPGERIWISPYEMRKVSDAEAAEMIARAPAPEPQAQPEPMPAAIADPDGPEPTPNRATYHYSGIETSGFVTLDELAGAAAILDGPEHRTFLTQPDLVEIGLGQGEVAVGDQFDIFRPGELVTDPSNRHVLGRITIQLGWLEVTAVHDQTATAIIHLSRSEIEKGDHVMPRRARNADVTIGDRVAIDGVVAFTPDKRMQMGSGDVVYLNRGARDGLVVGSPIEVYASRGKVHDGVRKQDRGLPDRSLAKGIVVDAYDHTAVAVMTNVTTEINRGMKFRGSDSLNP